MTEWIVSKEEEGQKLVTFILQRLGNNYSARQVKRFIEDNYCQLNGRMERFASTLLSNGDKVFLRLPEKRQRFFKENFDPSRILFEDSNLVLYDKPAGVTCDNQGIICHLKNHWPSLFLVHRLDKDTTGVLILVKNQLALEKMVELFRQREIIKIYWALVDGVLKESSGLIINDLGKVGERGGQVVWGSVPKGKGEAAWTSWTLQKRGKRESLLACFPKTGRTHQIRVHLSEMGHPILGDYHYCRDFKSDFRPLRPLLHAKAVDFIHPFNHKPIHIEAPLPSDFKEFIEQLT